MNNLSIIDEIQNFVMNEEAEELKIDIDNENYKILDSSQANFFLRRIKELEDEKALINSSCDNEINSFKEKIERYRNEKNKNIEGTIAYFTSLLEKYAHSELDGTKKKSLKLPFGTLQFKKSPDKYEYDDKAVFNMVKENNLYDFIRVKEELNKSSLNKALSFVDDKVYLGDKEIENASFVTGETKFSLKL